MEAQQSFHATRLQLAVRYLFADDWAGPLLL
jgi:hypothetical protein